MANPQRITTFTSQVIGDGLGIFDPQQKQSYVLNAASALVFQRCDGQTTPEQLTELLCQKFNIPCSQAERLLWLTLDELGKANLLQNKVTTTQPARPAFTRREVLNAFAAAGLSLALAPIVAPLQAMTTESTTTTTEPTTTTTEPTTTTTEPTTTTTEPTTTTTEPTTTTTEPTTTTTEPTTTTTEPTTTTTEPTTTTSQPLAVQLNSITANAADDGAAAALAALVGAGLSLALQPIVSSMMNSRAENESATETEPTTTTAPEQVTGRY